MISDCGKSIWRLSASTRAHETVNDCWQQAAICGVKYADDADIAIADMLCG
jgi:hypothetical protein